MFAYLDENINKLLEDNNKIKTIGDASERRISIIGPVPMPVQDPSDGTEKMLRWYLFVRRTELETINQISDNIRSQKSENLLQLLTSFMSVNSLLLHGDFEAQKNPLIRVHSCCMTGDIFGSKRCECGPQLERSFELIFKEGAGGIVYMANHEGRGIGLWAKGVTYLLQDMGQDTYQANETLGLPADSRDFTDAAIVLKEFLAKNAEIRLLSNNPMKYEHLTKGGIKIHSKVPLIAGIGKYNMRYLKSKREKGHTFSEEDFNAG